jgi:hypothetical protein
LVLILLSLSNAASAQQPKQGNRPELTFWDSSDTYLWPTEASRYASATFGETRAGHFHSALDMKTWGRKGYKVFATRDGILHYISIGPRGYGKVVYLKHNDGSLSVYAHLMEFAPKIRAVVDSLRLQSYAFDFEENMEAYDIRFKKGDVIAYTGESGNGPPHLHFELRTPDNRPFNPLLTNLSIKDHRPPQFSALSIEPLTNDAMVYGGKNVKALGPSGKGGWYDFGTAEVTGTVGLGVDVFDRADDVYNVYAVYELSMEVDGKDRFYARVDSFSYEETDQMFLDRVYPILQKSRDGYQRLFIVDGNTLPFYDRSLGNGKLRLEPGTHEVRITAKDYFGNTARAKLTLKVRDTQPQPYLTNENAKRKQSNSTTADPTSPKHFEKDFIWSNDWVASRDNGTIYFDPRGSFRKKRINHNFTIEVATPITAGSGRLLDEQRNSMTLHRIYPDAASTLFTPDHRFRIDFPAGMVYDTLSVGVFDLSDQGEPGLALWPDHAPFRPPFRISTVMPRSDSLSAKKAFYAKDIRKDEWDYISTTHNGQQLIAEADRFGPYRIMIDQDPPEITRPKLYKRADGLWVARVRVTDARSGVDYTQAEIYLNGMRGIPEFDPENDFLIFYHPDFEPKQQNTLKVILPDHVGNRQESTFEIPLR